MTIVYPVSEPLQLQKARDARIMRMAAGFAGRGHTVYLIVAKTGVSRDKLIRYYGVPDTPTLHIIQLPFLRRNTGLRLSWNTVFHWGALAALRRLSLEAQVDVVYLSVLKVATFLQRWRRWLRVSRWIFELHEFGIYPETTDPTPQQRRVDAMERRVLPYVDGVVVPTAALAQVLVHRFPHARVAVIPLGTSTTVSGGVRPGVAIRAAARVGYVGQLYRDQGVDLLVEACARLPGVELHVIGGQPNEIERLRGLANELGLSERVILHGFVAPGEVPARIADMDVLVLPARNTVRMNYVAHIKLYEYFASGRPVVATSLRSTREELVDGDNAVLVEPDNPDALAEGIRRVLDDPDFASRIASRALETAPRYAWETRTGHIEEFIQKL